MSEIARVEGNTLTTKMQYAQAMAGSSLLPGDYRGKPANLLFALEYADALGIAPIHAITSIHVISGKPSASADLIAASVRRAGHKLRISGDGTRAVAQIIRADDPDFTYEAVWDKEKAQKAGLWGTGNWAKYPAAMLRSRAITEVARMGASDALFGVIYTPEELGANVDADGAPVDLGEQFPQPEPQQQAPAEQKPAPKAARRKPPTLAEAMAKNADTAPAPAPDEPAEIIDEPVVELITEPQSKMMFALLNKNGFADDGTTAQKDYLESIIGRQLTSRRDITKAEATRIIDLLNDADAPAVA